MTAYRNVNGAFRACPAIYRNVGGTWRQVQNAWRNVGGTWRQFYAHALGVSVNPNSASASSTHGGALTTNSVTAVATGGTGSYTYAWTLSGDSRIRALSPNSATTAFQANLMPNDGADATATCIATDTNGTQGQATASVQFITSGGGQ